MKQKLLLILSGAISFWLPVTIINLLTKKELSITVGTLLPPLALLLCYCFLKQKLPARNGPLSLWMLLGVYMLGTWFIYIAMIPTGGGFAKFEGWFDLEMLLVSMVFPWITLMFSGYHGTAFGLSLATITMFVIRFSLEPGISTAAPSEKKQRSTKKFAAVGRRMLMSLVGGISFWGPITTTEFLTKHKASSANAILLSPATLLLSYFLFRKFRGQSTESISLWMLLGVWLLGALFMSVGPGNSWNDEFPSLYVGGTLKTWLVSIVWPFWTLLLAHRHSANVGLLLAIVVMALLHQTLERKSPEADTKGPTA